MLDLWPVRAATHASLRPLASDTRNMRQLEAAILTHDAVAESQRLARVPGARLSVKRRRPQIEYSILADE